MIIYMPNFISYYLFLLKIVKFKNLATSQNALALVQKRLVLCFKYIFAIRFYFTLFNLTIISDE